MKKRGEYDVWYIENWSFPDAVGIPTEVGTGSIC